MKISPQKPTRKSPQKSPQKSPYKTPIDLSLGYQNIDGIHSPQFGCKLPYLHSKFSNDLEVISETWGSCAHEKNVTGYKILEIVPPHKKSNVKKGRASGGIIVYCKEHLEKFVRKVKITPFYVWILIDKNVFYKLDKSIKICVVYNPPENSKYCNKDIYDDISLDLLQKSTSNHPIIIMGDLNSRTGTLEDHESTADKHTEYTIGRTTFPTPRQNQDKTDNNMGRKLIELCKSYDLQILNGRSTGDSNGAFTFYDTSHGASAIDLAIASDPITEKVKTFIVNNPNEYSSHCKIELRLDNILLHCEDDSEARNSYPWIELGDKYVWQDDSKTKFQEALKNPNVRKLAEECHQYIDAGLVEQASEKLIAMYIETAKLSLETKPKKKKTYNSAFKHKKKWKKWFDEECRLQKNITRRLAIMKHKHPDDKTWRTAHNLELKTYKKLCNKKKYEYEQNQIEKLSDLALDPGEFWKEWKQFDDNITTPGDNAHSDGKKWEQYFTKLYDDPTRPKLRTNAPPSDQETCNPINAKYTMEELDNTIDKLKLNKAAGKDKLLSEFLKASPPATRKLLLRMINLIYSKNIVPKSWCLGIITPIHKEGPKDNPDNYRGICIGSALSKVLSTMMNQRLTEYTKANKSINKAQIGFEIANRTSDHILTVKSLANKYVTDNKGKLYACFIDFRKAFDTVWHEGLFVKLEELGITGNFLNTLQDMYEKTECAVKMGNRTTQYFKCKKGVRQGDPLSPLLFNIFINKIFDNLNEANCDPVTLNGIDNINALAYADDIVLLSTSKDGLQKALTIVHQYCQDWRLKVNCKKTKCMTFSRGTQKEKTQFKMGGEVLENVKEYKYLGIIINKKNCTFTPSIKALRNKATRALYAIKAKVNIHRLPIKMAFKLFDALIKPILLYASEVWEPFIDNDYDKWDHNEIEKVHTQFIKQLLGVNRSTTNILVRGETNRHSLLQEVLKRHIKYMKYVKEKEDDRLVTQALNYERNRDKKPTFLNTILRYEEELLNRHNDDENGPHQHPHDKILDITEAKLKAYIKDIFHNIWKTKLEESIKGKTYQAFKTERCYERYLDHLDRKSRRALIKFRTSDHKLMIEEGRHKRIPRENRWCKFCSTEIEDEQHMLVDCKLYGNRTHWFSKISEKCPNFTTLNSHQKFLFLMSQGDDGTTQDIAQNLVEWLELREIVFSYFYDT